MIADGREVSRLIGDRKYEKGVVVGEREPSSQVNGDWTSQRKSSQDIKDEVGSIGCIQKV